MLTFFYVSVYNYLGFGSTCNPLVIPIHVTTLTGDSLMVDQVHLSCIMPFAFCLAWDLGRSDHLRYDKFYNYLIWIG